MKYVKKPVVIEAIQVPPEGEAFTDEQVSWIRSNDPRDVVESVGAGCVNIETLEGIMTASPNDWIIRGVQGELYPCKPDIFAATYDVYSELEAMSFGQAVEAMKSGKRVARKGWNGSGMFAYYVPVAKYPAQRNTKNTMVGMFPDDLVPYRHYIALKTAQNDIATWSPSTSDALAEDWRIVEVEEP